MAKNKIIYNGNTLIDLTGDTVTADKLMQGYTAHDRSGVQITGTATQGGSVTQDQDGFIVLPPDGGGGGGGDSWTWMGKNPSLYKTLLNQKIYLKDSPWASWTPSTTSAQLESSTALTSETLDLSNGSFVQINKMHAHFDYTSASTGTKLINDYYYISGYDHEAHYNNLTSLTTGVRNAVQPTPINANYGFLYINSSGGEGFSKNTYGIYVSSWSNTNLSSTGAVSTFTPTTPDIYARCSTTYFTTENALAVNQNTSYYEMRAEIWKVDIGTTINGGAPDAFRDMCLNGF